MSSKSGESSSKIPKTKSANQTNRDVDIAVKLALLILLLTILSRFFAIVNAGERGVLMHFGQVQKQVLGEGIHLIVPIVSTVKNLSVRVQKQEISAEASSKDLQDVFTDVALNWHIVPEEANAIFQQIGDEPQVVDRIINPAVEEVLKVDKVAQALTGGVAVKIVDGTQFVATANPDTAAVEFNVPTAKVFKPGDANWFVPDVTQAYIDTQLPNAPTEEND
ncbi:MAG: SPFH domain-containing protein [Microcoleus anatoxicus]|uniref:SPFH domain-containing protein n=1 Tax=Microcoleus anatoxicus TaxID=2705319 RepID=UPI00366A6F97